MRYLPQEIIRLKRDGHRLSEEQFRDFAEGVASGEVSEAQIAAFSMAVFFTDIDVQERIDWTCAVRDSGLTLSWDDYELNGPVVDKHSTGGVGDGVSLMLGPMLAACGVHIPMLAGRGLAYTGGTIDKLDAIPGYDTGASVDHFQKTVQEVGIAIVRQTEDLAPADRRIYAVRDVTATVENIGLITASIVSKKLAAGLDSLVLDVKTGDGAVISDFVESRALAQAMVDVANGAGVKTTAIITDMSEPLSFSAGNSLEVHEAIDFLSGLERHPRLDTVIMALGSQALFDAGVVNSLKDGVESLENTISSGRALRVFSRMVQAMGGPADFVLKRHEYLIKSPVIKPVYSESNGFVNSIDVRKVGYTVVKLGGGRTVPNAPIDHSVGLTQLAQIGEAVGVSGNEKPLCIIHALSEESWEEAAKQIRDAFIVYQVQCSPHKIIHETIS